MPSASPHPRGVWCCVRTSDRTRSNWRSATLAVAWPRHCWRICWSRTALASGGAGLGLGLAVVRQLVELHGGRLRAESPGPGLGASFYVALPLARPAIKPQAS
nr:ATP-binding protein [Herbaspirillum huttiense]